MPTRANIILSETHSYRSKNGSIITKAKQLFFYRLCDGDPEGIMPVLKIFLKWIKEGKLKNNLGQCGSWLVILGAIEYNSIPKYLYFKEKLGYEELNLIQPPKGWKFSSIEPASALLGDIDFLYEIDIVLATLVVKKVSYMDDGKQVLELLDNRQCAGIKSSLKYKTVKK
jgi:hypothetical protein